MTRGGHRPPLVSICFHSGISYTNILTFLRRIENGTKHRINDRNIHDHIVDEQCEIEADAYALQFSSKRDLRNACYKLMEIRFGIKERWRAAVQFFAPQWRRGLRLMF